MNDTNTNPQTSDHASSLARAPPPPPIAFGPAAPLGPLRAAAEEPRRRGRPRDHPGPRAPLPRPLPARRDPLRRLGPPHLAGRALPAGRSPGIVIPFWMVFSIIDAVAPGEGDQRDGPARVEHPRLRRAGAGERQPHGRHPPHPDRRVPAPRPLRDDRPVVPERLVARFSSSPSARGRSSATTRASGRPRGEGSVPQ